MNATVLRGVIGVAACVILFGCDDKRVHVDATLEVLLADPSGAPIAGQLVSFRSVKYVGGEELDRSVFDLSKSTDSTGRTSYTVGYNVTTDEDVGLEAWSGDGTNRDRELITGGEVLALASGTSLAVVARSITLVGCPTKTPSLCGGKCTSTRYDPMNCGTCGHPCAVDCLDGSCVPCSNVAGSWAIKGDCPVVACTVTQDTCGGSLVCQKPEGGQTDPAPVTSGKGTATFGTSLGDCNISVSGDSFTGTCGNGLIDCSVMGTRSAR